MGENEVEVMEVVEVLWSEVGRFEGEVLGLI